MKTSVNTLKNLVCIIIAVFFQMMVGTLFAQVNTPNCTSVDYRSYAAGDVALFESQAAAFLSARGWTGQVTKTGPATGEYNCHSFAWYLSEGGTVNYWINLIYTRG